MARVAVTVGALLPYWRFLAFNVVFITDDYFASDIFNGELPGRVLVGQTDSPWTACQSGRVGSVPACRSPVCRSIPLASDRSSCCRRLPLSTWSSSCCCSSRRTARTGSRAASARIAPAPFSRVWPSPDRVTSPAQLKHLGIVSTIVWLPVGLGLLDRVLDPSSRVACQARALSWGLRSRSRGASRSAAFHSRSTSADWSTALSCCSARFSIARALGSSATWLALLGGIAAVTALGAASGAVALLPLSKLGAVSDRAEALGWEWATRLAYWPPNVWTFLQPYIHGDISDNTYIGPPFFWEDYGYVGVATVLLAIYGGVRERRRPVVAFTIVMTLLAYLFVLGAATPVYRLAYLLIPGLKLFRFPTRFLFVVELGLALLGAIGLTRLRADLQQRAATARIAGTLAMALCAATVLDLFIHQPRQNPMVSAREWLAPPPSIDVIRRDTSQPRTFTPRHRDLHRRTFQVAHGWSNVEPVLRPARSPRAQYRRRLLEHAVRRLLRRHLGAVVHRRLERSQSRGVAGPVLDLPRLRSRHAEDPHGAAETPRRLRRHARAQSVPAG